MATTTNYGWDTPDDTDLVKDGAAAIRTLGSSIDTTTKNLNPQTTTGALAYRSATANVNTALPIGTANQVLRVNSGGTAPEWATTADQTPLTTKGDLFGFDTADARIPIGTNGHILTADSTQSLGLKWAAPAGGITWEAWTPVYNAWTIGNATVTSLKASSGDMRFFYLRVVWGSTTTFQAGYPNFELPYAATYKNTAFFGDIYDASARTFTLKGQTGTNDNNCYLVIENASSTYVGTTDISNSVPMTWTTNDKLIITGAYPV